MDSEDAFTNITEDSIMNNRIHGNENKSIFSLHSTMLELKNKCLLILTKTDNDIETARAVKIPVIRFFIK